MSAFYTDSDVTVARVTGARRWSDPFNESRMVMFEEDYVQSLSYWRPLPLDTRHPNPSPLDLAVLVDESPLQDLGGGIVKWTRTYATIPEQRFEFESYSYTIPGLETGTLGPQKAILSAVNGFNITTITTAVAHGFNTGDLILIRWENNYWPANPIIKQTIGVAVSASGSVFVVPLIVDSPISQFLTAQNADIGRDATTEEINSMISYEFFLPGLSPGISTARDIPEILKEKIIDANGKETDIYGSVSTPSKTEYLQRVSDGEWVIAASSSLRRWKGNIFERLTRYVKAR